MTMRAVDIVTVDYSNTPKSNEDKCENFHVVAIPSRGKFELIVGIEMDVCQALNRSHVVCCGVLVFGESPIHFRLQCRQILFPDRPEVNVERVSWTLFQ